jgi:hypothetical protein
MIKGESTSSKFEAIPIQPYAINGNDEGITSMTFDLKSADQSITFKTNGKSFNIPIGNGVLKKGEYTMVAGRTEIRERTASYGAWISPDTLQVCMYFYETPFNFTHKIVFDKDDVTIIRTSNVNIGPATRIELTGRKK